MALEELSGWINTIVGWAHLFLAGAAIYFLWLVIKGGKKEGDSGYGPSAEAVEGGKSKLSGLFGGKKDEGPAKEKEDIEKGEAAAEKEEEWALKEYQLLKDTKKLLDSDDPKQIYQAAKRGKSFKRILKRLNRYWKRSTKNFKKLKDSPKNIEAKKLNKEIKLYFQKILVLLESNFPEAADNMLDTIDDKGLLKKSKKDPRKVGTKANFYKGHLNKMKAAIDNAIKWDIAFVQKIRELEKIAKELEKGTK